jgi:hypothetical protein
VSRDLLAITASAYAFLLVLWCWMRYLIHYKPRGKHPRRHGHGTPYKGRVRRG